MKFFGKIPLFFVVTLAWIVIISSCANQGMPTGGPKDTVPPVLLSTQPKYKALSFDDDEIRFTFNEYVITDQISEILVVSPPLKKRPSIRTKSKTVIIKFNEDLKDSTTYSLDFKNSIVDNNERNPLNNMRFSFSTGDVYDSLRVAGSVVNSFNMEPVENALVLLHNNLHDSAVYTELPDFIAKTDEYGVFMIDNIPPGSYHLFSLNDANSDLKYNEGAEEIAFFDSIIVPSATFEAERDTLVRGVDSLLITGHTHFLPEPIYLRQFTEDLFEQYIDSYTRSTRYKCNFVFNESVDDTFNIQLVDSNVEDWYILEPNSKMDSITFWITDTLLAQKDTLLMDVSYFQLDSTQQVYVHHDTLQMNFSEPEKKETPRGRRRGRDDEDEQEDAQAEIPQFVWETSFGSTVELNEDLKFTAPEPLKNLDKNDFTLYLTDDTLKTPLEYKFTKDSVAYRTYNISANWEPETGYTIEVDSAAAENIYGITSKGISKKFKSREDDYYGQILANCTNVDTPTIVQLLDNNEEVLSQKRIDKDQTVTFEYLEPAKYIIKVILDRNNNGKWDTGSYQDKYQPEEIYYLNSIIKVRSNWDSSIALDLTANESFVKKIIDHELEEQKRKEAEEKAKKEAENERRQQNNLLNQGSGGGLLRR
ncbi:Ig-like domain-containing protein [Maribellus maritimus]|uniref:Ig-like domain-containing protein n=1 Tax=Maribellus maritimus TaxID=2870838 RepID=UPI001EEB4A61|nr:Ig-like domain-containing protein [Maribellus maritimus]MCG6189690.1 Ig-like domain-containing protein [Maribellus maritimus]